MEVCGPEIVVQFLSRQSWLPTVYFSDPWQGDPNILGEGGDGGVNKGGQRGFAFDTAVPFTLIPVDPKSSGFEFHNSRRVELENVSPEQRRLCSPPKGGDCVEHFNWLSDLRLPV